MPGDHSSSSRLSPSALLVVLGAAAVIAAAVVVPLELVGGSSAPSPPGTSPGSRAAVCASSGCAVVNTVRTNPRVAVFYGASCSGVDGDWFLNVAEEGPAGAPHPAYSLRWTFSGTSSVARPNGTVSISPGADSAMSMTIEQGVVTLKGTTAAGIQESGIGTLTVALTQSSGEPALELTETGLSEVEGALGLLSPFGSNGRSETVPIKVEKNFAGC
jgi:hypothetical protein